MLVEKNNRKELWSQGKNSKGMLGQGNGKTSSDKFEPLDYDKEQIQFVKAGIFSNFGLAVTDKGELYAWGSNEYGQLGLESNDNVFSPTEIPFFKDYYIHDFAVGLVHSLIDVSPRADMNKRQLFTIGKVRGYSNLDQNANKIAHLKQFDDSNYSWIQCGNNTTLIGYNADDENTDYKCAHKEYTCEVTNQSPIMGTMHFWKSVSVYSHRLLTFNYRKINGIMCLKMATSKCNKKIVSRYCQ